MKTTISESLRKEIYLTLCEHHRGLTARELGDIVGISTDRTNQALNTLDDHGYLTYVEGGEQSGIGTRYFAYDQVEPTGPNRIAGVGVRANGMMYRGEFVPYGKFI